MNIRVSEKHGVNPSVMKCFFCQRDVGVALLGRLPGDAEAPRSATFDKEPCDECKRFMERGVILISVDEEKSKDDHENPWRSGGWIVMRDEAVRRMVGAGVPQAMVDHMLQCRVAFIGDEIWDKLQLPRGPVEGVPSSPEDVS